MKLAQILFRSRERWAVEVGGRKMRKVWNEKPLESDVGEHDKI